VLKGPVHASVVQLPPFPVRRSLRIARDVAECHGVSLREAAIYPKKLQARIVDADPESVFRRRHAGRYAYSRYKRGLHAYRRRLLAPLVVVALPFAVFYFVVSVWRGLEWWSFAAGVACASSIAFVIFTWGEPPQHVQNWKRGADGERETEKELRRLERIGWKAEHDVQRDGRANLDHVVSGPPGVFLLETKAPSGTVTFEDGVLVVRQLDDPDEIFRYTTLTRRLRGQAAEVSRHLHAEIGRRQWVNAVVVIWGNFAAGHVEHEEITYIRGDLLADWLVQRPLPRTPHEVPLTFLSPS